MRFLTFILDLLPLLYPFIVYFGLQNYRPRQVIIAVLVVLFVRFVLSFRSNKANEKTLILAGLVFCAAALWHNSEISLLFYPVLINFTLLMLFVISLFHPPTIIERIARFQHPDLPAEGVRYTRQVTIVWSLFFFCNGLIACLTALFCSIEYWSLYNGLIAYLLMGVLMGVEYLVRIKTQAHVR